MLQPLTLGKYQLLKKIATGGMAEIWVARSTGISSVEQVCVVKRILPELATNADFVRMFLDEARIAATLNHPNLSQMYDVGEAQGSPFIAMEYLHGEDVRMLRKALRPQKGRMPLDHALNIAIRVADGLHYAHEKVGFDGHRLDIVHRDISPHNVFVTYDGGVKILDFGIAKAKNRDHETLHGTLKGKVPYMSPEQCLCESLDRRSDIYSLGVILYELTTGPRLHKLGASEYEMMRAILEAPIARPSAIVPGYPPELERIVLRCLQRDKDARYPTARELQADLEAFAREERLAISSIALSSFMADLFGSRVEAWREALASGRDLLAHIVERQPPAVAIGDEWSVDEAAEPAASSRAEPSPRLYGAMVDVRLRAPAVPRDLGTATFAAPSVGPESLAAIVIKTSADLVATKRRVGDLLVVTLAGKLTEGFQGSAVARELAGRVIFDLAGVQRITSFGVREWLQMLLEVEGRVAELWLFRCSEPIVNQLSMIRGFAGDGRVASFTAPYRCDACGGAFARAFDVEIDAEAIRAAKPPAERCPRCGQEGAFDDDPASFFAFAVPFAGAVIPPEVRAAHEEVIKGEAGAFGEAIEMAVDARGTRVTVRCPLDGALRWKRILDGIEGRLVFDLAGSAGASPDGAASFERALRALGPEVDPISIEGCPGALLERFTSAKPELRAVIASAMIEARCAACSAQRATLTTVEESASARREGREPHAVCPRCSAPLSFAGAEATLRLLEGGAPDPAPAPVLAPPAPAPAPAPAVVVVPATGVPRRGGQPGAVIGVLLALVLIAGGFALARRGPGSAPLVVSSASPPVAPSAAAPARPAEPAWLRQEIAFEGGGVLVVGGGAGASEEEALTAARNAAVDRLSMAVLAELSGSDLHAFVAARLGGEVSAERQPEVLAAEAARYLRQVGSFATPERVDAVVERGPAGVTVRARYRLRKEDLDAAAASYRKTATALGMTVARVFPLLERALHGDAELIVIGVDAIGPAASAGVRAGELVVSVAGRTATTVDAFAAAAAPGAVELQLESAGARRTLRVGAR